MTEYTKNQCNLWRVCIRRTMVYMRLWVPVRESFDYWYDDAGYCLDRITEEDRG